jgi:hypothetical protein
MRLLAEKEKRVPDAQPSKNLDMVSRSLVVRCGSHRIFFIIGISYLGVSTRAGQVRAASNPSLVRWGLIGAALLLVLLVVVVGAVFLLK